jgi:transcriptional regulator with XRE-family HTH domain
MGMWKVTFARRSVGASASAVRSEAGLRRTCLSVHSGLGRPFMSNIERGQKELCLRSLEILAVAFGISLSQLMRGI